MGKINFEGIADKFLLDDLAEGFEIAIIKNQQN